MKFIIIFCALFITVFNGKSQDTLKVNNYGEEIIEINRIEKVDCWFALDKGQHFTGSLIGTLLLSQANNRCFGINKSESKKIGVSIVFSIGVTKELLDSKKVNNIFSWKDLAANIAGILTAIAMLEIK